MRCARKSTARTSLHLGSETLSRVGSRFGNEDPHARLAILWVPDRQGVKPLVIESTVKFCHRLCAIARTEIRAPILITAAAREGQLDTLRGSRNPIEISGLEA